MPQRTANPRVYACGNRQLKSRRLNWSGAAFVARPSASAARAAVARTAPAPAMLRAVARPLRTRFKILGDHESDGLFPGGNAAETRPGRSFLISVGIAAEIRVLIVNVHGRGISPVVGILADGGRFAVRPFLSAAPRTAPPRPSFAGLRCLVLVFRLRLVGRRLQTLHGRIFLGSFGGFSVFFVGSRRFAGIAAIGIATAGAMAAPPFLQTLLRRFLFLGFFGRRRGAFRFQQIERLLEVERFIEEIGRVFRSAGCGLFRVRFFHPRSGLFNLRVRSFNPRSGLFGRRGNSFHRPGGSARCRMVRPRWFDGRSGGNGFNSCRRRRFRLQAEFAGQRIPVARWCRRRTSGPRRRLRRVRRLRCDRSLLRLVLLGRRCNSQFGDQQIPMTRRVRIWHDRKDNR